MSYTGTQAISGRATTFSIGGVHGATGTEVFTVVGELMSAPVDPGSWNYADATNFQSNIDEEFIPTTRTGAEIKLKGNLVAGDAGQALIIAAHASGQPYDFKETLPLGKGQQTTGNSYTYTAYVKNYNFTPDVKSAIQWEVALKISGPVTFTAGS